MYKHVGLTRQDRRISEPWDFSSFTPLSLNTDDYPVNHANASYKFTELSVQSIASWRRSWHRGERWDRDRDGAILLSVVRYLSTSSASES